jgi:hypothetical protein
VVIITLRVVVVFTLHECRQQALSLQQLHITLIFIEETRKQLFRPKIAIFVMWKNQPNVENWSKRRSEEGSRKQVSARCLYWLFLVIIE